MSNLDTKLKVHEIEEIIVSYEGGVRNKICVPNVSWGLGIVMMMLTWPGLMKRTRLGKKFQKVNLLCLLTGCPYRSLNE